MSSPCTEPLLERWSLSLYNIEIILTLQARINFHSSITIDRLNSDTRPFILTRINFNALQTHKTTAQSTKLTTMSPQRLWRSFLFLLFRFFLIPIQICLYFNYRSGLIRFLPHRASFNPTPDGGTGMTFNCHKNNDNDGVVVVVVVGIDILSVWSSS